MVTDTIITVLEGFCRRIARQIVGMTARKGDDREWEEALVDVELDNTRIWPIREYVRRNQVTITDYIAGRPISKLCTGAKHIEGSSRFLR